LVAKEEAPLHILALVLWERRKPGLMETLLIHQRETIECT